MVWLRRIALALLGRYGASLRFPHLLLLTGALFGIDVLLPDGLPFLDELFLGLMTLLFASWKGDEQAETPSKSMRSEEGAQAINVEAVRRDD